MMAAASGRGAWCRTCHRDGLKDSIKGVEGEVGEDFEEGFGVGGKLWFGPHPLIATDRFLVVKAIDVALKYILMG